ncbi:cobalamin biosynthesis protein [Bermanella sp. 47_1433_sub80_T6]|nr:cobalamin biosynthesis protein [Bermanella sp. 47_1433_sub80_T6]
MTILICVLLAFTLDFLLGEAKRFHPLVGFGNLALAMEKRLNSDSLTKWRGRLSGLLAWCLVVIPLCLIFFLLETYLKAYTEIYVVVAGVILYVAIGWQSLLQHAMNIARPLQKNDMNGARMAVSMIVSRDAQSLDEEGIAKAATESVLENGADAIFSAVFWFVLAGIPGVVLYRLSNTLDAMWGYKNKRFLHFGWCAARVDDVLNFIPARLTALSYALVGHTKIALQCWRQQGMNWKSPNAGPVMAAGAGALNVTLGGAARYHSQLQHRPGLGPEKSQTQQVSANSIVQACALVNRAIMLWVFSLAVSLLAWELII